MSRTLLTLIFVSLMAPAVARAADGAVHLYLQPLAPEATRLRFTIGSITAVTSTGAEYPLKLNLRTVGRPEAGRQRLLASGRLPVGSYSGFSLTVRRASLDREQQDATLALPDAPARIDFPFSVAQRRAALVWLTLRYPDSVSGGAEFHPVFWAVAPPMPIADHAGFVTNSGSNTITVFDKRLGQAVAAIETCAVPRGMALDQRRRRLYVACSRDDEIQAIDVATGEVVERTSASPGDRPSEITLTPDGLTLLAVNTGSSSVSFFDAVSLARHERIGVGSGPGSVTVEPAGRRAFVFNTLASSISVIDLASRSVAATVSVESSPVRGQFNRRADRLFVTHERSPYMTVLDPRQLAVTAKARLRTGATAVAIDSVRDLVCVGGTNDGAIDFYEPNALMPLYSMRTSAGVSYVAIDVQENSLYMVSPETRSVSVARLADRKVVSEIDVGDEPYWVAVMGEK